jgi:hypothetical protein
MERSIYPEPGRPGSGAQAGGRVLPKSGRESEGDREMAMRRARRRGLVSVAALCVAVAPLLAGCGDGGGADASPSPTSRPGPKRLTADFESGTADGWTETSGATVTADAAHDGGFGLDVAATDSDAYARWVAPAGHPDWAFRAWVRVVASTPGESVDLFTVRNLEITNNFDLFIGAGDRAFQWDLYRENAARAPGTVEPNRWYLVEARGSFAGPTSTAEVRIDGVPQPSIASPGQPRSAVRELVLGSIGTKKTNRVQFDDVHVEVGDAPIPFLDPPVTGS